jgi:hypothetical protein
MNKKVFGMSILLMMTALACTCNLPFLSGVETPPPLGGETPLPPSPQAEALFRDDFGDSGSGWEVGDYDNGSVGYKAGAYFVTSTGDGSTMWGVANQSFSDIVIEIDATQVSAPANDNNDYGVVCREQEDGSGYYFLISGDGLYAITRAQNDEFEWLVDFTESDVIRQGNAANHIQVTCDGSTLELSVNGQRLATTEDSAFTRGDIALTATSYEDTPTEIHFDNLVVRQP